MARTTSSSNSSTRSALAATGMSGRDPDLRASRVRDDPQGRGSLWQDVIGRDGGNVTSSVISYTYTVSHADVLYVSQQMGRDLKAMKDSYPEYLNSDDVFSHQDSLTTLIVNDAIERVGFSIVALESPHAVFHELRYEVGYGAFSQRQGVGGGDVNRRWIPRPSRFQAWVVWSKAMLELPRQKQAQIVQATLWSPPGGASFRGTYSGGTVSDRARYQSGILFAQCREYLHG